MHLKVVSPVLGFESIEEFSWEKIDEYFSKLQSLQSKEIVFTLIDPLKIRSYDFSIPLFYKNLLKVEEGDNILVRNIVLMQDPIENSSINFMAPLIINEDKQLLAQVALDNTKYPDFGIAQKIEGYLHG